ncbi:permease [Dechloromonas agitata]|uniref:permease n=1 Tax=Dechloromonas agitata TaxID=73030 RepID=UPI00237E5CEF|nr:permease [Dechloromonas agitata]MDE1546812.1 permease [Dechloromonas agitata]
MDWLITVVQSGLASLASYLAAHVLLCLVPAFFIAGGLSALVPQQSIIRYLGPDAPKWMSYSAAAGAGSLLAVCSCTIQPLFAGIYKKGAGLGPAITFLFFAPAANILALSYTGVALGADFAIARILLALSFGIGIGMIMAVLFRTSEVARLADSQTFAGGEGVSRKVLFFLGTLVALLIAGTLKLDFLKAVVFSTALAWPGAAGVQQLLDSWVPVNAATGAEGLSLQGALLIALLAVIGATAWQGLGKVDAGFNRLTPIALGLVVATLVFAAMGVQVTADGISLTVTGRTLAVIVTSLALLPQARRFDAWDVQQWLWETWRFVKMIFPLLVVGVFLVGVIRVFIQPEWIQAVAGSNTLLANLAGVVFGVFMYFPTLVEVPIAKMFLSLGMHPGPLIAYLMADPELSLQSILITSAIIGKLRAWTYVGLVALFSTLAGLTYGAWVDGTSALLLGVAVAAFILLLSSALHVIETRRKA